MRRLEPATDYTLQFINDAAYDLDTCARSYIAGTPPTPDFTVIGSVTFTTDDYGRFKNVVESADINLLGDVNNVEGLVMELIDPALVTDPNIPEADILGCQQVLRDGENFGKTIVDVFFKDFDEDD